MSYNVFPQLSGITWNIKKRPTWNTTKMLTAGGNEFRTGYRQNPLTEFDLSYSYLSPTDKLSMEGFFNGQNGALTPFYFDLGVATNAPSDNSVTAYQFGTGDGATTAFTLLKPAGTGASEPIGGVNGAPQIYKNDWQGNQLQYATPRTNNSLHSEDFSQTSYRAMAAGVATSAATSIAPGGATLKYTFPAGFWYVNSSVTVTGFTAITFSTIFEAIDTSPYSLTLYDATTASYAAEISLNVSTGVVSVVVGTPTYTVVNLGAGPNGGTLFRLSISSNVNSAHNYLGEWVQNSSINGIVIHAEQTEVGLTSTNFIPTTTSPVTVTDYTLAGNQITFAVAPLLNASMTWTGNFYYLVRFMEDVIEFNQLMNQMYELQECKLVSVQ